MPKYIFNFVPNHEEFRIPELDSISELFNIKYSIQELPDSDRSFPALLLNLENDQDAHKLGSRLVLVKSIYKYWTHGSTYEELHESLKTKPEYFQEHVDNSSWKFTITTYNHTLSMAKQRQIIEAFSWMAFKGPIKLKSPDLDIGILQFNEFHNSHVSLSTDDLGPMKQLWMGQKICDGQRNLVDVYNLKKRKYVGNTSMEAEISLLMANQAQANAGKILYDPFVGTGSMLHTCAHFGAYMFGSDIDGRQMRGKGSASIFDTGAQYKTKDKILDCLTFDLNYHPWRQLDGGIFDAIITDPPYGVRAGAKRLGSKREYETTTQMSDGSVAEKRKDYIPPTIAWEMSEVLEELLEFANQTLRPKGRLVYFLPTASDIYQPSDVPQHEGLRVVANSEQNFGKWSRRLITMEKIVPDSKTDGDQETCEQQDNTTTGHYRFREKYFQKRS